MKKNVLDLKLLLSQLDLLYKVFGEDYCYMKLQEKIQPFKKMYGNKKIPDNFCIIKQLFQEELFPILHDSSFCRYTYAKPLGYAGDYQTQIMIWDAFRDPAKRFIGKSDIGKLLSCLTFRMPNCRANALRIKYLQNFLSKGFETILSVGSGPAIEYWEEFPSEISSITLLDQETKALEHSIVNVSSCFREKVDIRHENIIKYVMYDQHDKKYDCIYLFGLLDYFNVKNSKKIVSNLWESINGGGSLLLTNAHYLNDTRAWMELGGEWFLDYKDIEDMYGLAGDIEDIDTIGYKIDEVNVYQYLELKKR